MEIWMIYTIVAVIFIVVEIFYPTMFCINFAFAAIVTALVSLVCGGVYELLALFVILSALSLIFIKPILVKYIHKEQKVDFDGQYKGKIVKVIETVTKMSGAVTIYEERWEARLSEKETEDIPAGNNVKIVENDSTILFVERI